MLFFLRTIEWDRHFDRRSAAFARRNGERAAALLFQAVFDVVERGMGFGFVAWVKTTAVVLHRDKDARARLLGSDGNGKRSCVRVHSVLDRIFNKRLQSQRRQAKACKRRIILHEKAVLMLCLFYGEIRLRMFQLVVKRNGILARNRVEVLSQIIGEIHGDLLCLIRILLAEVVDGRHRVVDKVRTHLQDHNAGALIGDLLLLFCILFDVIREDKVKKE